MENEKKKSSGPQTVLNVLLIIVCCSIFVLFIYDYVRKNNELANYKDRERIRADEAEAQLAKVNKLANLYKETSYANTSEGIVTADENERIKKDIAKNVAANLSPILSKVDKDQNLTHKKLDKVLNELIALLEKETEKSKKIRKELRETLKSERARQDRLQKQLTETRNVVTDLNGMVGELKALYIAAHEDDSAMGDIARAASAPAKFVKNTFTFDWFVARDRREAEKKIEKKQAKIMAYYDAIGDPAAMKRLKKARQILDRKKKIAEPEIIKKL